MEIQINDKKIDWDKVQLVYSISSSTLTIILTDGTYNDTTSFAGTSIVGHCGAFHYSQNWSRSAFLLLSGNIKLKN